MDCEKKALVGGGGKSVKEVGEWTVENDEEGGVERRNNEDGWTFRLSSWNVVFFFHAVSTSDTTLPSCPSIYHEIQSLPSSDTYPS